MVLRLSQRYVLAATILLSGSSNAFVPNPSYGKNKQLVPSNSNVVIQSPAHHHSPSPFLFQRLDQSSTTSTSTTTTTSLSAKAWNRLEIEEDEEPMWYLLNCIAGLELDLLRQCRARCMDFPPEDIIKFVVPIETSTRSHGPNRIVTETKVKYQGYVFGKLRLCEDVYEAIQELDLCRSWMGTVNRRGYKKLPPAPLALNEEEIEKFGLECLEEGMEDEYNNNANALVMMAPVEQVMQGGILLDTEENDEIIKKKELKLKKVPKVNQEQLQEYMDLRPDDMIKVTGNNKFKGEDGIVKRLKGGKIMVRFYTYGSTYDEWLEPKDVRKMSNEEILRGLSGPTAPVSQEDLEGGARDKWSGRSGPGGLRDALMSNVSGNRGPRNNRQARTEQSFQQRDMFGRTDNERKNWNWYQDQQRGTRGGPRDGRNLEFGVGSDRDNRANAQADVDGQWGRFSQRQERRDRGPTRDSRNRNAAGAPRNTGNARENQRFADAIDGDDDWSAFVSTPSTGKAKKTTDDDFFDSLMAELNADKASSKSDRAPNSSSNDKKPMDNDDDFFSSLMSELNDGEKSSAGSSSKRGKPTVPDSNPDDNDFFAALEAELGEPSPSSLSSSSEVNGDSDDFFAKLEAEMLNSGTSKKFNTVAPPKDDDDKVLDKMLSFDDDGDDFFASLERELSDSDFVGDTTSSETRTASSKATDNDFFSDSMSELVNSPISNAAKESKTLKSKPKAQSSTAKTAVEKESTKVEHTTAKPTTKVPEVSSNSNVSSLERKKVPELKEMLKERGLKVSGKKSELIERLLQ